MPREQIGQSAVKRLWRQKSDTNVPLRLAGGDSPAARIPLVRTVVVSDLHLGLRAGNDVARRPEVLGRLIDVVRGADRLVLLGDILELRERTLESAIEIARPLFEDLAGAMGAGEMLLVPGNHDHAMLAPLAASIGGAQALHSLENRLSAPAGHPLARLARDLSPARLGFAYPGVWLDHDVYATHGHYMDAHSPVPMVECLAIAISARLRGGRPLAGSSPVDYERVVAPVYGVSTHVGRGQAAGRGGAGDISVRLYERLVRRGAEGASSDGVGDAVRDAGHSGPPRATAGSGGPADLGDRLLRASVPRAVAALNRLGLGPFDPDISGSALRRAGLRAMAEVIERLDIEAEHVIFGHTHRPGPLPNDLDEWTIPGRGNRPPTRLMNTGSWVYSPLFLASRPSDSPYWPGRCVLVEDGRPPELLHPLADSGHKELARAE